MSSRPRWWWLRRLQPRLGRLLRVEAGLDAPSGSRCRGKNGGGRRRQRKAIGCAAPPALREGPALRPLRLEISRRLRLRRESSARATHVACPPRRPAAAGPIDEDCSGREASESKAARAPCSIEVEVRQRLTAVKLFGHASDSVWQREAPDTVQLRQHMSRWLADRGKTACHCSGLECDPRRVASWAWPEVFRNSALPVVDAADTLPSAGVDGPVTGGRRPSCRVSQKGHLPRRTPVEPLAFQNVGRTCRAPAVATGAREVGSRSRRLALLAHVRGQK